MGKCFIIQPFDKGTYDKRYRDVFEPAIKDAGLDPYRVDRDYQVKVPIEEIEKNIREAEICFAEITTDNPNVWYELGFAFACKKNVVLVCESLERKGKFPFDIQHRQIINYTSESTSDFNDLKNEITSRIKALNKNKRTVEDIIEDPVKAVKGFKQHEIALMMLMLSNQVSDEESVPVYSLKGDMQKAGFTEAATGLAIMNLKRNGFIEVVRASDGYHNEDYSACKITSKGEDWLIDNQDKVRIMEDEELDYPNDDVKTDDKNVKNNVDEVEDVSDDIPF